MRPLPTAPIAAATFITGYAVVAVTGSRTLGGVVLLLGGAWCAKAWMQRHGSRTAATLLAVAFVAFVASHLLAPAIGAWPSVLLVSALMAFAAWTQADAPPTEAGTG